MHCMTSSRKCFIYLLCSTSLVYHCCSKIALCFSYLDSGEGERGGRRSPSPNSIRDQMLAWCQARLMHYEVGSTPYFSFHTFFLFSHLFIVKVSS